MLRLICYKQFVIEKLQLVRYTKLRLRQEFDQSCREATLVHRQNGNKFMTPKQDCLSDDNSYEYGRVRGKREKDSS